MKYLDALTDASFKKDDSGNDLFYPWGIFGTGYIIDSENERKQIRWFLKKIYIFMFATIILIGVIVGFWLGFILLPIFYVWYYFKIKKITEDLNKTEETLTISESVQNSADSINWFTLILLELVSLALVVLGILIVSTQVDAYMAYASIVFFGLCSVAYGYMVIIKSDSYMTSLILSLVILSLVGLGLGLLFFVKTGFYYFYCGNSFDYQSKVLKRKQTLRISNKGALNQSVDGIIDTGTNYIVKLSSLETWVERNKIDLKVMVPFTPVFGSQGDFIKKLITWKNAELIGESGSAKYEPLRLHSDIPDPSHEKGIDATLTVEFDTEVDISNLTGLNGTVNYWVPTKLEKYEFRPEPGKYELKTKEDSFKIVVDGKKIFLPDSGKTDRLVYLKALDAEGKPIKSAGIFNSPKTFRNVHKLLRPFCLMYGLDNQLSVEYEQAPRTIIFYLAGEGQEREIDFELQFQTITRTVDSPDAKTHVAFPVQPFTMKPIKKAKSGFTRLSINNPDSPIFKWEGQMSTEPVELEPVGLFAVQFYDSVGRRIKARMKPGNLTQVQGSNYPNYEFSYESLRKPSSARWFYLLPSEAKIDSME